MLIRSALSFGLVAATAIGLSAISLFAQRPTPTPMTAEEETEGFQSIFDGKTLAGWDGDPKHWSVQDGALVGQSTAENPLERNTFVIWRGGAPGDFELKLEYRIDSTNSGIQYRSVELPDAGKWVLKGYQADIDAANVYTGQIYEERGRGFLALRGQVTHASTGKTPVIQGSLGDGDALKAHINVGDWNKFHLIARGNILTQIVNGQTMSMVIDDDLDARSLGGLLGIQLHVGDPMKVEVRNVWIKPL